MPQRPKLGQNLLVSPTAQTAIADALGDVSRRTVVEIGPGRGAITAILAVRARRLVAIELDRNFAAGLREQFANWLSVEILEQNVLAADFAALRGAEEEKLLIVGNLPYYITSDILLRLFRFHASIERAVVMVQREVAVRIAAQPGTSDHADVRPRRIAPDAAARSVFATPAGAFNGAAPDHGAALPPSAGCAGRIPGVPPHLLRAKTQDALEESAQRRPRRAGHCSGASGVRDFASSEGRGSGFDKDGVPVPFAAIAITAH
jgi:16S rRNA (adenine1518-N6/adenine1519-N6)-dimethyltransferase